ncbi:PIN domain-containing protein [Methylomonas methanica]|uniref:PIN domain-containing protein n=1 Tax=Methylomonas methanica TaxID=421 RepID=UPI0007C90C6A|nr:PIN domain-containing protein [Methylomonas methanica]
MLGYAYRLAEPLPDANYHVCVITEIELLSYPALTTEDAAEITSFLHDVTIVDLKFEIKKAAIDLRRQYRLKLPDALIVATAYCLKAQLFSNDVKLSGIAEISTRSLLLTN